MTLENLIRLARRTGASDLHLEGGLAATIRVHGDLQRFGEPLPAATLRSAAEALLTAAEWQAFREVGSAHLSRVLAGIRCRVSVLQSQRGVGFAVRLLGAFQPTLERLNLHPDLAQLVAPEAGLVVVAGPTGAGKSSTLAAFVDELNRGRGGHLVTIENPIEFFFRSKQAFIRQREVGRDTPSFQQALMDVLREDPDVVLLGEMRDPETIRLTLNLAETGHLVLTTMHASNVVDAVQSIVAAFPAEAQNFARAQLADCLGGIICQQLRFREDLGLRLPECEVLRPTHSARNVIRQGQAHKLASILDAGGQEGHWSRSRYRTWMDQQHDWYLPDPSSALTAEVSGEPLPQPPSLLAGSPVDPPPAAEDSDPPAPQPAAKPRAEDIIVLREPTESIDDILSELDD